MNQNAFRKRVYFSIGLVGLIVLFLLYKLFTLHYSSRIIITNKKKPEMRRGYITDRNGYVLALSIETDSLYVNPQEITDHEQVARSLVPFVAIDYHKILKKLQKKDKKFVWLDRRLDSGTADRIKMLNLPGVYFKKEYKRVYPNKNLASNIIGFVGVDNYGLEGIEYAFESMLSGHDELPEMTGKDHSFISGKNIVLTIDRYIQHITEKALADGVRRCKAKRGALLVLEVETGKILALAKYPNFDPNYYYRYSRNAIRNYTVIDSFEPGSTLKIFSLIAIMEEKPSLLKKTYRCKGFINVYGTTIRCPHVHGVVGIHEIISESCNVGIIKMIKEVKSRSLYDVLDRFGFGRRASNEMPGESEGILRPLKEWSGLSKYSISIGHELSVTSVQLGAAFGAIANDGIYMVPTIIERIENADGKIVSQFYKRNRGRVVSRNITKQLLTLMRGVVVSGTGKLARSSMYKVVGKTGTSEKYSRIQGAYSENVVSSFVGLAPYNDPKYCILVIVDNPVNSLSGGKTAAPIFRSVIDKILIYGGIRDRVYRAQGPLRKNNQIALQANKMPDLSDRTIGEITGVLSSLQQKYNCKYSIKGSGKVYAQKPLPGEEIKKNSTIIIYMRRK